jgi:hypothetical protein
MKKQIKNYIKILEIRKDEYLNHKTTADFNDVFNYRYNVGSAHRLHDVIKELKELLINKKKNMKQLELTPLQLTTIGFKANKTTFEIKTINGCIYYNPNEKLYKWYHETVLGERANHIHMDIKNTDSLYCLLEVFQVKYNKISSFSFIVDPVIKYLAENHHPHTKIIIESDKAELVESINSHTTDKFILD